MMYPNILFSDKTQVLHSQLIKQDGIDNVIVHFERPTKEGVDIARCMLPKYEWIEKAGYTDEEIQDFNEFLRSNAHLLFRYAKDGGIKIS